MGSKRINGSFRSSRGIGVQKIVTKEFSCVGAQRHFLETFTMPRDSCIDKQEGN
jgi:hypothetical protein